MPGRPDEYLAFAVAGDIGDLWETWADGTRITDVEWIDLRAIRDYHRRRSGPIDKAPQRAAMRLLRSLLSPAQRAQLRVAKEFRVTTPAGHTYRIHPGTGTTQEVTKHGGRWFVARRFCLHDDRDDLAETMPPADLAIAHLLLLIADEVEFLTLANATGARDQLWNGDYLRRMRHRSSTVG